MTTPRAPSRSRRASVNETSEGRDDVAAKAAPAWRLLRDGLALADADIDTGREELRTALAEFEAEAVPTGRLLAGAALLQCIGIADDDYTGFEDAVAAVLASRAAIDALGDDGDRLSARAGALVAGWFRSLDDPALPAEAERSFAASARAIAAPFALARA